MKGSVLLLTSGGTDLVSIAWEAARKTGRRLKKADICRQTFEILSLGLEDVDLAIVDIGPSLHSLAILEALNYSETAPPVIALIEVDEAEATPIVQRHGAAACLKKPFGADELATLIDNVCASACRNKVLTCDKWGHVLAPSLRSSKPEFNAAALRAMNKYALFLTIIAMPNLTGCRTTEPTAGGGDRFATADANHDGKLSRREAIDYFATQIFNSRDLNHDGRLTWQEWHVPGAKDSKADFEAADTDKDGTVNLAEAKAYARKRGLFAEEFRKADTNHDGFVTRQEAEAYIAEVEGPPR